MTNRSLVVLSLVALLLSGAAPAHAAAEMTVAEAINQAGRQRMLSQRQAVAWLLLGLGVAPQRGRAMLKESMDRFDTQLAALKTYTPNDDVQRALSVLEREWAGYRVLLGSTPTRAAAQHLYQQNDAVQMAAHRLTLAYEKISGATHDRLVNIAGRQRMLSQ